MLNFLVRLVLSYMFEEDQPINTSVVAMLLSDVECLCGLADLDQMHMCPH